MAHIGFGIDIITHITWLYEKTAVSSRKLHSDRQDSSNSTGYTDRFQRSSVVGGAEAFIGMAAPGNVDPITGLQDICLNFGWLEPVPIAALHGKG
jgi:hypothetical protein